MRRSICISLCLCFGLPALNGCTVVQRSDTPVAREPTPADRSVIPKRLPAVADEAAYQRMLKEAREWQRKAASVDGEWRDVQSLLEQAEQAAAKGDFRRAIELAESARFQSEMGYRQMRTQERVVNPPFLYY